MQVFYHLGELNDALSYALGAGPLFDVEEGTEYANTLLGESHNVGNVKCCAREMGGCKFGASPVWSDLCDEIA